MENKIERYCEDCKVRLITKAAYDKCFNLNHNIRVHGHFTVVDSNGVIRPQTLKEYLDTPVGLVMNDAKKGDLVEIKL